ncbi:DUF3509 domain-containing protein [Stutzerimonas tarimensis]|uniref:DUF3509 domain-containing protein n=1 Tax=Stutzerimonas tarimensis TaxID=1507735 RepID=A0ABV7T0I4_9GAMM
MSISPFKMISDVFQPRYNVNFCIEKPDGSILLTLTDAQGVAVKRYILAEQWRDRSKLERLIQSLCFSLAIERGEINVLKAGRPDNTQASAR